MRVGNLADSRLISRTLGPHRICAFASPAYLAKRGTPLELSDLADHDCVNFRYQSSGQVLRWPFSVGDRMVESAIRSPVPFRWDGAFVILRSKDRSLRQLLRVRGVRVSQISPVAPVKPADSLASHSVWSMG
nr:LysR substrate-binding domain-containing protein [Pseudomonas sp. GM79]